MSKTSKYWKLREQENRQRLKTLEFINSYNKQIEQTYRRMLDSVQKEIDAFYGRYADKEGITIAEARKRVSQLDIEACARKAKQYVQDKNFSDKANAEMKLYNLTMKVNRLELLKSNIGLELVNGFDDLEKLFGEKLTEEGIKEFRRQAGILGDTVTDTDPNKRYEELADRLARASFHNATFSDRIWMHQDLLRNEIDKSLQQALISGRSMERLARDIRNAFGTSTKNAQRLMRTEIRRMQTDVAAESYKRNGNEKYEYMALGQHPCDICSSMNGKIYNVKDMEVGLNAPPMHPNCMCSTAPYVDEKAYQEWLDSFGEANEHSTSGSSNNNMSNNNATNTTEAEAQARKLGVEADYSGIDIKVANEMNLALERGLKHCPDIIKKIKVIGNAQAINKKIKDELFDYYKQVYTNQLGNGYTKQIESWAKKAANKIVGTVPSSTYAFYRSSGTTSDPVLQDILDKYQGIYVNKNYGKDFNSFLTSVEKDVKSKWHPEGTGSVASVFDHEVGHLIDHTIKLRDSDTIKKMYYNLKKRNKISDYLSKYACNNTKDATNIKEFIAEAYAEAMNNSNPRKVARAVWFLMKKKL